ncbi:MAG TPA: hypothetical protein VG734_18725 [Lacunisphaera sp.]|nr:hypothetical protein [Lacunisphaera sp.]
MIAAVLVFLLFVGGATLAVAGALRGFNALERIALGAGAALVGLYLATGALWLAGADWRWLWLWPIAGATLAWRQRAGLKELLAESLVGATLAGWLVVAAWSAGLHALVFSYSGGTWAVDWFEHYERALFFQQRWPADHVFVAGYLLPARPPLANLAEAGLLAVAGHGFPEYQLIASLVASLVFLPLAALAQAGGTSPRAVRWLVVLLLLCPLFAQNATFPWTKLPAAFFVVLAVALGASPTAGPRHHAFALVALAAGLLTHYSVAPWIIALAAGAAAVGAGRKIDATARPALLRGGVAAVLLAATWFGWAALHFGPATLATATSTVGHAPAVDWTRKIAIAAANVGHSLVPDFSSPNAVMLLAQTEVWGRIRDVAFVFYQVNLLVAFGVGNVCVLGWLAARSPGGPTRRFWLAAIGVAVALGIGTHSRLDELGLAHISLQPLILMGLAWVARAAGSLPGWLRVGWGIGLAVDFALGIVLHFGLQSLAWLRALHPGTGPAGLVRGLSEVAVANFENKYRVGQPFVADLTTAGHAAIWGGLACLLGFALWRARFAAQTRGSRETAGPRPVF